VYVTNVTDRKIGKAYTYTIILVLKKEEML